MITISAIFKEKLNPTTTSGGEKEKRAKNDVTT